MEGESHTLTVTKTDKGVKIVMASTPGELEAKIDAAVEACTTATADITKEKKACKQNEKDKIAALGTELVRVKEIKGALGRLKAKFKDDLANAKDLDEAGAKKLAHELASALVEIGRKFIAAQLRREHAARAALVG